MHELGVVFYVIKDVKNVAAENNINKVKSITLEIGEVSGVIHEQLLDCFKWASNKEDVTKGSELKIETIPAITYCEDCGENYETVTYGKICPNCNSEHTYLLQGNEFNIKEIEVYDEDEGT